MATMTGTTSVCSNGLTRCNFLRRQASTKRTIRHLLPALLSVGLAASTTLIAGTPPIGAIDTNLVPNASLQGNFGVKAGTGTVNGNVPTVWRAFSQGTGVLNLERLNLAADTLYPGSPPTQAIKLTIATFGSDQGFDSNPGWFSIIPGMDYDATVYARTGNADNSAQAFTMSLLTYDISGAFNGNVGTIGGNASSSWLEFNASQLTGNATDRFGKLIFRMTDDGGENSLILALPTLEGPAASNTAPNPGFNGSGGASQGAVTGTIPDNWRGFSVGAGSINLTTVPVAADELYTGSPTTNAIRVEVTSGDGNEGFDHELRRAVLHGGLLYRGEVYLRSGNAGMAPQDVSIGMPIFDVDGTFSGLAPGSFNATVGSEWSFVASPQFGAITHQTTNLAFRPISTGNSVFLIAAPRIVDPTGMLFFGGFDPL